MTAPSYHLVNIEAGYKNKTALKLDELALRSAQLNVVAGSNGSGKSTLLNVLAFLMQPKKGIVVFSGQPVHWEQHQLRELRRRVTLVHQDPFLFRGSVALNIAYGPKARGVHGEALRLRVRKSLDLVGLSGFESRHANRLSGGEARRVALARALACKPEAILLDEPLAYVDEVSTKIIEALLVALVERGVLVVISSHDPTLGRRLKGRTIRLREGRVVQHDDKPAMYDDRSSKSGAYPIV